MEDDLKVQDTVASWWCREVSILVLMEDDLKASLMNVSLMEIWVSILVLMEDDLKVNIFHHRLVIYRVSILVLMEDDLKGDHKFFGRMVFASFNPCFNGRWSERWQTAPCASRQQGFNPCFNGRWSESVHSWKVILRCSRFNPCFNGRWSESVQQRIGCQCSLFVSILVLMEDDLKVCTIFLNSFTTMFQSLF